MPRMDETVASICAAMQEAGTIAGYAYDHFRQSDAVEPPFAVYRRIAAPNFSGDGIVYHHGQRVDLEIYAETPEEMAQIMAEAETLLDAAGIFYTLAADTAYIESEDFYESLYEM